mmetsp:Transcript_87073/g.186664  ORF Transcript_87073/g.186664 Transcript_87073/m.186664 type:complete len:439 (+) Transcript_87073:83-1399(+)
MGGLISAPLSAAGTCLGACCGSFTAAGCCKLAASGSVSSERAARCVLVWLQAFTAALAMLVSVTPGRWLPWTCDKLDTVGMGDVGICACSDSTDPLRCWSDQLVYRTEAAGMAVFLTLLIMAVSGCAQGASRSHAVAKFMAVFLIGFALLFVPNDALGAFGQVATIASAVFLVAQSVLLIDFAYTWNETWYSNALAAHRREIGTRGYRTWLGALMAASATLFFGSVACSVYMYTSYPDATSRGINLAALLLSLVLLVVSITDWCEHGALLTSTVVSAYIMWLVYEMLAVLPSDKRPIVPLWAGLSLCALSLAASAQSSGSMGIGSSASTTTAAAGAAARQGDPSPRLIDPEGGHEEAPPAPSLATTEVATEDVSRAETMDFAVQCATHVAASLYICASLAPKAGDVSFAFHAVAVFASLALYGWSLAAPKILTNRSFS